MKTRQVPDNFVAMLVKARTLNHLNHDLLALMQEMARGFENATPDFLALALKQAGQISAQECEHVEKHGFNFPADTLSTAARDDTWYSQTMGQNTGDNKPHGVLAGEGYASFNSAEPTVVKIEYWWDRISHNWIIQAKDKNDNQVGAAEYAANTRTLPGALEAMQSQYPNVACVKS